MGQVGPAQRVEIASGPLAVLAPLLQQILPPDVYQAVISGGDGTYGGGGYEVVVAGGQATVYKKVGLQLDFHLLPNAYWQAGAAVNIAQAARDGARATLNQLRAVAADPQAAQARVDAAHSAYLTAQANLEAARASLETLKAGATEEELTLARTQVEQARADLSILETQRARTRLTAPRSGVVTQRYIAPGELVVPGAPLLTLADLSDVTLTAYVPVDELGHVHLGQAAAVCVDSFPARTFQGTVVTIADEAEFTPSATQTEEARVNLVFAVKVRLANVDGSLKPGMPADATFDTFPSSTCRGATTKADEGPIEVSGMIEGQELTISSEIGGPIAELRAAEGDQVRPGDVLLRLDDTMLQAKLAQAQAQVEVAQASRDLVVVAGPRPGEIAAARAAVSAAEATRDGALQAWHNAIIARDDPQELEGHITAARAELEVVTHQVEQARLALQATELERNQAEAGSDARRVRDAQVRAAAASLAAVEAARDGAQAQLYQLYAIQTQPLAAEAQMRAAADQYAIAAAGLQLAQARLVEVEAGPDDGEIAVADARVRQAQAAAAVVLAQQRLMTLTVPVEGAVARGQVSVVTAIVAHEGEIATAGAPLLTLTRLDPVQLTLYIPTDQIGRVALGQPVAVRVDSFPDETFRGQVVYISSRAEFTPHSLQTRNERVRAVFAIRVRLPNAGSRLKPGMPADAVLE
jgi:HlyD family secretion protein